MTHWDWLFLWSYLREGGAPGRQYAYWWAYFHVYQSDAFNLVGEMELLHAPVRVLAHMPGPDWARITVYIHHHFPKRLWGREIKFYRCHPASAWRLLLKLS